MGGGGGFKAVQANPAIAAQKKAEEEAKKLREEMAFIKLQQSQAPGVRIYEQNAQEKAAGIKPPSYEGTRDLKTGELLAQYRFDPYKGEAMQKLREQAFAEGDSPWAKLQLAKQQQEQLAGGDVAARQGLQAMSQGQAALAASGGLSSGARERMARGGARDLMMAKQQLARQGIGARLGIQEQDLARKQSLLSDFGNAEQRAQAANIEAMTGDVNRLAAFEANRYGQSMSAFGAKQAADAQRAAAAASRPKSGGCCFIFLEARYGNGTMDKVVRRYRDENMTVRNCRGYYRMAEVLVPLMRKYPLAKLAVRLLMTDPLVSYGKWYYGEGRIGWIFAPVKTFWLGVFDLVGGDHEFIRENGEVV